MYRSSLAVAALAVATHAAHPVREDLVSELKSKAETWKPKEAHLNHLRHMPEEVIRKQLGGNLGVHMNRGLFSGAKSIFNYVSDIFGFQKGSSPVSDKSEFLKLKQEKPETWENTESAYPKNFSWKDKMPECLGPIED